MGSLAERLRLIVITDAGLAAPRSLDEVVAATLAAGAPAVQLRDKGPAREALTVGRRLRALAANAGALFIVNDRLDLALALDADGVHLGPTDLPVAAVRAAVPAGFVVGRSAGDPATARAAAADGADYIGSGPVFPTRTKRDTGPVLGPEGLELVARSVDVPVVAIGGVTTDRVGALAGTGAAGAAVIGAVMQAADPRAAVRALLAPWSA